MQLRTRHGKGLNLKHLLLALTLIASGFAISFSSSTAQADNWGADPLIAEKYINSADTSLKSASYLFSQKDAAAAYKAAVVAEANYKLALPAANRSGNQDLIERATKGLQMASEAVQKYSAPAQP